MSYSALTLQNCGGYWRKMQEQYNKKGAREAVPGPPKESLKCLQIYFFGWGGGGFVGLLLLQLSFACVLDMLLEAKKELEAKPGIKQTQN